MTTKNLIQPDTVILVSGGARGITAQCVVRLAEEYGCRFIMVGRSALAGTEPAWAQGIQDAAELKRRIMNDQKEQGQSPTPQTVQRAWQTLVSQREIQATLNAVAKAGGQAVYISADVTDTEDLRRKLAPAVGQLGPVTGILHGAGSLADKRIENKTQSDFEKVYNPKVKGLESMLACVAPDQLRFVVLFSSVAGFYGNLGQADYALANEILNKTAHRLRRQYPTCQVLSINWGPWEAGMVTPELKKAFAAQNIKMIPVDVGAGILASQLAGPGPVPVQIVVGSAVSRPAAPVTDTNRVWHIERSLRLADNPFLEDHRIGGNPVLPATCGTSWMIHACEQLFPGYVFSQMQDYRVLKGIVFEDQTPETYTLEVKLADSPSPDALQLDTIIWSETPAGRPRFHYRAGITLVKSLPEPLPGQPFPAAELADPAAIPGHRLYADGTLFHGPAFQGVQRVLTMSMEHIHMENSLPQLDARIQGQFPARSINPFLNDSVVQALLIWTMQYYQAPCLPASLERLENYATLSFGTTYHVDLQIRSHSATSVVGDLLVQDQTGKPYIRFVGLEGTISKQLTRYIGKVQPIDQTAALTVNG